MQKKGLSTGAKIGIAVGVVAVLLTIVCCGGWAIFMRQAGNAVVNTPAATVEARNSIVQIDVPPEWQPKTGMDMNMVFMRMKMALHEHESEPGGVLIIAAMDMSIPGDKEQIRMQQEMQLQQMLQQQGRGQGNLVVRSSEARDFDIGDSVLTFEFAECVDDQGNPIRKVAGTLPAKEGSGFLMLVVPEAGWDEESVVRMIESIQPPE